MRIEAILFDLDDTLTDWHGAVSSALAELGATRCLSQSQLDGVRDAMRRFVCVDRDGTIVDRQHWRLAEAHEPWSEAGWPEPAELVTAFRDALLPRLRMHDDFEVVAKLAAHRRVGMLTNNPYARTALEEQGHLHVFEEVVMAEEPYRKPHPRAFAIAASLMRCSPSGLVYVGDSIENDVEGALASGWTPIWIDRFNDGYDLPGVVRITTLRELPTVLDGLCESS